MSPYHGYFWMQSFDNLTVRCHYIIFQPELRETTSKKY